MDSFPSLVQVIDEESPHPAGTDTITTETTNLLPGTHRLTRPKDEKWRPGHGFIWVEIGKVIQES